MGAARSSRLHLLSGIPLFGSFSRAELEALAKLFAEARYQRGDTVFREGDDGDTFLVIVSGELEVWGGGEPKRVINRLGPGDFLGEITLLTGGKRTAMVRVARTALVLTLDRGAFDRHLSHNPRVLEYFSRVLSQRLASVSRGSPVDRWATAIAVSAQDALAGSSLVAETLAGLLRDFSGRETLLISVAPVDGAQQPAAGVPAVDALARDPAERIRSQIKLGTSDPAHLSVGAPLARGAAALAESFETLVAKLGDVCPYIVLDLGRRSAVLAEAAVRFAEVQVEIVRQASTSLSCEDDSGQTRLRVVNLYNEASKPLSINQSEPFVLPKDACLPRGAARDLARLLRNSPWSPASPPLRRLARRILGTSLGVALGGGAAFGIAHVGVLKVLDDEGIPIDLVAGTSFGSIVALGYAAGIRPEEMIRIARRTGTVRTLLSALDVTLTKPSLLAGDRVIEIFSPMTGPIRRFEQLLLPCRTVAADIRSGERVAIGEGSLEDAFRASCAVPLLWPPVARNGRVLVDGGVVDPVPADVVREMGAQLCIAVNVVPSLKRGVETYLSRAYRVANRLNPLSYLGRSRDLPNMFDLVMNTIQTLQYELGNFKAISADVRINADLSDFTWIDFHRALELIERGASAAENALPQIRRVLAARGGSPR